MQSPSNLIFFVLLGVWAAFFLQYWIRRREHLATAHAVDQFSDAMRVLDRTDHEEAADRATTAGRAASHQDGPPHTAGHRARPVAPLSRPRAGAVLPELGMTADADVPAHGAPTASTVSTLSPLTRGRVTASLPEVEHPRRSPHSGGPRRAPAAAPPLEHVRPGVRLRGLLFLASLVGTAIVVGMAASGILLWWSVAVAAAVVAVTFGYLRLGAARQRRLAAQRRRPTEQRRRSAPTARAHPDRRPAAPSGQSAASTTVTTQSDTGSVVDAMAQLGASAPPAPAAASAPASAQRDPGTPYGFGIEEADPVVEPEPEVQYVHMVDEDDIPLTWDPVPVPRPTYTMKAKAPRAQVAPAEVTPAAEPVADAAPLAPRRVAGA